MNYIICFPRALSPREVAYIKGAVTNLPNVPGELRYQAKGYTPIVYSGDQVQNQPGYVAVDDATIPEQVRSMYYDAANGAFDAAVEKGLFLQDKYSGNM